MNRTAARPALLARSLLLPLALALAPAAPAARAAADAPPVARRPNVLLILADDLNTDLGCYGHPLVQSPHLDRLAARGVRFERAYCQYPLCNPSRASFMTGLRPDTLRVYNLGTHFRKNIPDVVTLPQTFRRAGYFTARVGKVYHWGIPRDIGTDGLDDAPSWDRVVNPKGRDVSDEDHIFTLTPHLEGHRRFGSTLSWLAAEGADNEQTDGLAADAAIELLEQAAGKPFFLAVGFVRPHTPFVAPKHYFSLYPIDNIALPKTPPGYDVTVPPSALAIRRAVETNATDDIRRQALQAYYASTSFIDAQVGRLLDALDRLKLADNTIVAFTSDHGYHLGEKGLWQKWSIFERSARVPLIVAVPGGKANGQSSPRTVELLDLHKTLADLCALSVDSKTEGASLRPLLETPAAPWDRAAFSQIGRRLAADGSVIPWFEADRPGSRPFMGRSVRTERWRYTEWDGGAQGIELYDHDADPHELRNLASDPRSAPLRARLKRLLTALERN